MIEQNGLLPLPRTFSQSRLTRNKIEDINKAIQMSLEFSDELNELHPDAFDYALFYLNKMR